MNAADADAFGDLLNYLATMPPETALLWVVGLAFAWRLARGSSIKEIFGLTNGMRDDIKAIRKKVQELDVKVGRLDERIKSMEQYKP